jgi:hypothetical protein
MESVIQGFDGFRRKASSFYANAVEAIAFGVISLNRRKWHCILNDNRISADKRFQPDSAELMNARIRSNARSVCNFNVAGQRRRVRHDNIASKLAIVRDVGLRHQKIPVTDTRYSASARRSAMDCNEFAYLIFLANFDARLLACVF